MVACLALLYFLYNVDDFLNKFNRFGSYLYGISISAVVYADDLVLLAPSIAEMQTMLNHCVDELNRLDLNINPAVLQKLKPLEWQQIQFKMCQLLCIYAYNEITAWAKEVKYLGIHI